jgi:uncharacterized protein
MAEPRTLAHGHAKGSSVVLDDPLSLWGGFDPTTGRVIDPHHPQSGVLVTGRVLVMPTGRGSSSSSYVLAESIRCHTAPAAIVLLESDLILALGAMVAEELYGTAMPVVVVDGATYATISPGLELTVDAGPTGASIERT